MEISVLTNRKNSIIKFWRTDGTSMDANILLMCKMMFLLLVSNYILKYFDGPYIPFFQFFDTFREYSQIIKRTMQVMFLVAGISLWLNIKVRIMSLLLGVILLFAILFSKPIFRNHLFICSCAFVLASITKKGQTPRLLILQLSLVYLGAVLNKVIQIDWWTAQFMHNWLANARENYFYEAVTILLPDLWLAKILSWSSLIIEFTIGILLLIGKRIRLAVWMIIIFHTALYTLTQFRFGHFFEDILIYLLCFLTIPSTKMLVKYTTQAPVILVSYLKLIDLNNSLNFNKIELKKKYWIQITVKNKEYTNKNALKHLLIYSPGFYLSLFFLDQLLRYLLVADAWHIVMNLLLWMGILFFAKPFLLKSRSSSL